MSEQEDLEETEAEEEAPEEETPEPPGTLAAPPAAKPRTKAPGRGGAREPRWQTRDADELWPEMLAKLPGLKRAPADLEARIYRIDPSPKVFLQTVRGNLIAGSTLESPRDALIRVVDAIHIPTSPGQGAARYEIWFHWRVGGRIYGRGEIDRPSVSDIMSLRAGARPGMGAPPMSGGYYPPSEPMPPPPVAAPPAAAPQPPAYGYPPQGFGYPPPAQGGNEFQADIIKQLLNHMMANGLRPPPTLAAPPAPTGEQPPPWAQALVAKVDALQAQIHGVPQGGGYGLDRNPMGAAPVGMTRATLDARREQLDLMREMKSLNDEMTAFFSPATQETLGAAPVMEGPSGNPEDDLPYQLVEISGADPNGVLQRFARDKKTGNIDLQYTALNNPKLAEKALEIAGKLTDTLGKFFKTTSPETAPAEVAAPAQLHGGVAGANVGWSES